MMCIHALSHHQSHAQSNHHPNIIHPNLTNKEFECPTNECPLYVSTKKTQQKPHQQTPPVFCLGLFVVKPRHPFFPHLDDPSDAESWMASCSFNWPQSFAKAKRHRCSRTCAAMAWAWLCVLPRCSKVPRGVVKWVKGVDERCGLSRKSGQNPDTMNYSYSMIISMLYVKIWSTHVGHQGQNKTFSSKFPWNAPNPLVLLIPAPSHWWPACAFKTNVTMSPPLVTGVETNWKNNFQWCN